VSIFVRSLHIRNTGTPFGRSSRRPASAGPSRYPRLKDHADNKHAKAAPAREMGFDAAA
jgi:hypothetical protein